MTDGLAVTPADLVAHAGQLERIADTLTTARQAGQATRLDSGAYGHLCGMLPVLLGGLQQLVIDGIDTAAHSVRDTAGRVRTAANGYDEADRRSETALNQLRNSRR